MFKNKYFKAGAVIAITAFILLFGLILKNTVFTVPIFTVPKSDAIGIEACPPHYTDEELSSMSSLIIEGEVTSIDKAKWNSPDGKEPLNMTGDDILYKDNIIKVTKALKGNPGQVVRVRTYGGEDLTAKNVKYIQCDSFGSFSVGEKVVLFLITDDTTYNKSKSKDFYMLTGLSQGKCLINNDKVKNSNGTKLKSELYDVIEKNKDKIIEKL